MVPKEKNRRVLVPLPARVAVQVQLLEVQCGLLPDQHKRIQFSRKRGEWDRNKHVQLPCETQSDAEKDQACHCLHLHPGEKQNLRTQALLRSRKINFSIERNIGRVSSEIVPGRTGAPLLSTILRPSERAAFTQQENFPQIDAHGWKTVWMPRGPEPRGTRQRYRRSWQILHRRSEVLWKTSDGQETHQKVFLRKRRRIRPAKNM